MQALHESFRILRVRVEDQAPIPSVVVVSSALNGDGASYVAGGLARAFAEFRHRTLLVDAGGRGDHDDVLGGIPRLNVRTMFREGTSEDVEAAIAALRENYDVVIVDAPPLPDSSIALSLARASDGVILAVRLGRRKAVADDQMLRLLGDRRILGVVPTNHRNQPTAPSRITVPQSVPEMFTRALAPVRRALVRVRL
jgi:Mrp family chromosome partitioning ATPase